MINCLIAGNEAPVHDLVVPEWNVSASTMTNGFYNCLFLEGEPTGHDAVTGDPLFKDPANGDYALTKNSPAHDAGLFEDWMTDAVDLAGAPRVDYKQLVDIGCYELPYAPPATLLILR